MLKNLCSALFGQLEMLLEAIGSQQRCLGTHRKYDNNTQTALLIFNKVAPRFNQPKFLWTTTEQKQQSLLLLLLMPLDE